MTARRFELTVLASVSAVAVFTACGGTGPAISQNSSSPSPKATTPAAASNNTLTVDKVGFAWGNGGSATDQTTLWNGMALITNHSTKDVANDVAVQISAYGSAGQVVGTGDTSISVIRAGQQVGIATTLSGVSVPPTRLVVQVAPGTWLTDPTPKAAILGQNIHLQRHQYDPSEYTANGELVSTYTSNMSDVSVSAICFDSTGHIVGGGDQYLQLLPANGTAGVSVTVYANTPAGCQLYGAP